MVDLTWEEKGRLIIDTFKANGGNISKAAEAAGVSYPTAHRRVVAAGLHKPKANPVYTARLESRAQELYLSGLSCRGVAAQLARESKDGNAPSQEWVHQKMRRRGVLRSEAEATRLKMTEQTGIDYAAQGREAVRLIVVEKVTGAEAARRLGVSRNAIRYAVGDAYPDPAEATRRASAERTRTTQAAVVELRRQGLTYPAIAERLKIGKSTVFKYAKAAGLTGSRKKQAKRGKRLTR